MSPIAGGAKKSPPIRRELASNVVTSYKVGFGDVDTAFAKATHIFKQELWQHRGSGHSIETRGIVTEYRPAEAAITVHASTQKAHDLQQTLTSLMDFDEKPARGRPDIGGGFGPKLCVYSEDVAVVAATRLLKRSLKWIEDRREYFTNAVHERDQYWNLEIAVDADAKVLGVRGKLLHDMGAYAIQDPNIPYNSASTLSGPYIVANLQIEVTIVTSNKTPVSSVRGAGYPQAAFSMERLMDLVAREMKLDRAEVRRRNLIPAEKMPYKKPLKARSGMTVEYDSGDYPGLPGDITAGRRLAMNFPSARRRRARDGRYIGIGMAHGVKGSGRGPFESGVVRISRTGRVTIFTGASAMGQGLATALAQIAASQLGTAADKIKVVAGDTAGVSLGLGGFASRQTVTAGSSVMLAAKAVADKAKKVASHLLEASEDDLELVDGEVRVVGAPQLSVKLGEIARMLQGAPGFGFPPGVDPGLEATVTAPHRRAGLCQRLPRCRSGGRHRNRRRARDQLLRAAGLRHPDQPDDGRWSDPRRYRARHRQRIVRMDGLRRRGSAGDHDLRRLFAADLDRGAVPDDALQTNTISPQSVRSEGSRRSRHDPRCCGNCVGYRRRAIAVQRSDRLSTGHAREAIGDDPRRHRGLTAAGRPGRSPMHRLNPTRCGFRR